MLLQFPCLSWSFLSFHFRDRENVICLLNCSNWREILELQDSFWGRHGHNVVYALWGCIIIRLQVANSQHFKWKVNRETFESSCSVDIGSEEEKCLEEEDKGKKSEHRTQNIRTAVLEEYVSVACIGFGKIVVDCSVFDVPRETVYCQLERKRKEREDSRTN